MNNSKETGSSCCSTAELTYLKDKFEYRISTVGLNQTILQLNCLRPVEYELWNLLFHRANIYNNTVNIYRKELAKAYRNSSLKTINRRLSSLIKKGWLKKITDSEYFVSIPKAIYNQVKQACSIRRAPHSTPVNKHKNYVRNEAGIVLYSTRENPDGKLVIIVEKETLKHFSECSMQQLHQVLLNKTVQVQKPVAKIADNSNKQPELNSQQQVNEQLDFNEPQVNDQPDFNEQPFTVHPERLASTRPIMPEEAVSPMETTYERMIRQEKAAAERREAAEAAEIAAVEAEFPKLTLSEIDEELEQANQELKEQSATVPTAIFKRLENSKHIAELREKIKSLELKRWISLGKPPRETKLSRREDNFVPLPLYNKPAIKKPNLTSGDRQNKRSSQPTRVNISLSQVMASPVGASPIDRAKSGRARKKNRYWENEPVPLSQEVVNRVEHAILTTYRHKCSDHKTVISQILWAVSRLFVGSRYDNLQKDINANVKVALAIIADPNKDWTTPKGYDGNVPAYQTQQQLHHGSQPVKCTQEQQALADDKNSLADSIVQAKELINNLTKYVKHYQSPSDDF